MPVLTLTMGNAFTRILIFERTWENGLQLPVTGEMVNKTICHSGPFYFLPYAKYIKNEYRCPL